MTKLLKATRLSLLVHTLAVLMVIALGQRPAPVRPPVALDFSLLSASATTVGNQAQSAAVHQMPQADKPQNTHRIKAREKKTTPRPMVKKSRPPEVSQQAQAQDKEVVPIAAPAGEASRQSTGADDSASATAPEAGGQTTGTANNRSSGSGNGVVYGAGQLDRPLVAIRREAPPYPTAAKRQNIEGWIRVAFLVDEQGHVVQVKVVAAEPQGVFEPSVLRSISTWRFRPGTVGGVVVRTLVEQTITFKLE